MENKSYVKQINRMILGMVLFMLSINIAVSIMSFFMPIVIFDNMIANLCLSEAIFLIPAIFFIILCKPKLIRFRRIKFSTVLFIFLGCCLLSPTVTFLNLLTQLIVPNAAIDMMESMAGYPSGVIFLAFAIIPPLVEEFLFRGLVFGGYKKTANRLASVFMSAMLFGLVHGNLNQAPYAFALGIFLALLVEATGSILAPVIAHIAFNGWNVIMLFMAQNTVEAIDKAASLYELEGVGISGLDLEGNSVRMLFDNLASTTGINLYLITAIFLAVYLAFAVAFGILAFLVLKKIAKNENRKQSFAALFDRHTSGERIFTAPLIISVVILALFLVISVFNQMIA